MQNSSENQEILEKKKLNRGLKVLSIEVIDILKRIKSATYKEVADIIL